MNNTIQTHNSTTKSLADEWASISTDYKALTETHGKNVEQMIDENLANIPEEAPAQ